ncbi:MAG: radical SAM protein [Nitrospirae bacterium]|nr:MAG: radical SAM protein [Nitrospirota bacterium]
MRWFLSKDAALKRLETPAVYHIGKDELYELDESAFVFLLACSSEGGALSDENDFTAYCLEEGILTTETVAVSRPEPVQSPVPSLRYLELQITDRCNLRCRHCYIGSNNVHTELPLDEIRRILAEFEQMQGLRLLITGGEPLLHTGFAAINNLLPDHSFRKVLFTNGLLVTRDLLDSLFVDEVQVSIDGLEASHDSLRGRGSFRAATEAVRLCREAGIETSVSTMVHQKNLSDFEAMDRMFREMGIRDWTVDVPCSAGRLIENSDFIVTPKQGGKYLKYGYGSGLHGSAEGYGCGLHLMSVTAQGEAAKCTFYADKAVGSVSEGLRECWERIRPVRLDSLDCDCDFLESCRGGCRYRAELLGGPGGRDLYRCHLYDIMKT